MEIEEVVRGYHKKMSQINVYKRDVGSAARKESEEIKKIQEVLEKESGLEGSACDLHNMAFVSAFTGSACFYSQEEISIDDRKRGLRLRKNKQYQWLLAESYEEFEDFVEKLYAVAGFEDNDFWSMSDYGNEKISQIDKKEFSWFDAKTKNLGATLALKRIRKEVPEVERMEKENELDVDLRFMMEMVRYFRHYIVHAGGVVKNKEKMIDNIVNSSGVGGDKSKREKYEKIIENYFSINDSPDVISVLEFVVEGDRLQRKYDVFECTVDFLMSYADVISRCLDDRLHGNS